MRCLPSVLRNHLEMKIVRTFIARPGAAGGWRIDDFAIFTAVYCLSSIIIIFKIVKVSSMGNKTQVWSALPGVICCLTWSQLKHTEKNLKRFTGIHCR